MVDTSERTGLGADAVSRLLAAHGTERVPRGAALIGTADPPRVLWANRAAVELFGSDVPDVLDTRLFGGHGREGLASAIGRLVLQGGSRQERLRLARGYATRTVPVMISRWRDEGRDLLVLTGPSGDPSPRGDALADALRGTAVPAPRPLQEVSPPRSARPDATSAEVPAQSDPAVTTGPLPVAPDHLTVLGAKRFLWQSDAAGRLVGVDDGVGSLRRLADGALLGQMLVPALDALGVTGVDRLAACLAEQRSFSNVRVAWPLTEEGWSTIVVLGAVPVRGAAGVFSGFRGFGVMDLAKLLPHTKVPAPAPASVLTNDEAAQTAPTEPDHRDVSSDAIAAADTLPDPLPPAEAPSPDDVPAAIDISASFRATNIVVLRPSRVQVALEPEPVAATSLSAPEEVMNLSSTEQSNFDAIARALRQAGGAGATPVLLAPGDAAALVEHLPVALTIERGGVTVYGNAAFMGLTGYDSAAHLEDQGGWTHLLGGLDLSQVANAEQDNGFPLIHASGEVVPVEGRRLPVEWRGEPADMLVLRAAPDRVAQLQAAELDSRRRTDELREARVLLDRTEDAVVVLDARGRVLSLNAAARVLFGRPGEDAIGESIGAFLSLDGQSAVLGAVFAAGAAGAHADEVVLEAAARRRPGALPYDLRVRALGPDRVSVVIRDRTTAIAQREETRHLRDELDNAAQTRADFLAKVSHEIRTPLNTVIGFSELMLEERFGPIGSPRYLDYLTDIHDAGRQAVGLLGGLVDLSSVSSGEHPMTPAATDVNAVVGESVAELQGQAHRDRVIVRQSLAGNLPRALVDAEAMRQVMDNILSNAIQFNEPGGQVIVSTALHESGAVVVRVRDTGIGMSDAEIAIAMEPFRQLVSGRPGAGSGLGLPRARALAEANQATLSIRSRKSEGTLVEVSLRPASDLTEEAPAA